MQEPLKYGNQNKAQYADFNEPINQYNVTIYEKKNFDKEYHMYL